MSCWPRPRVGKRWPRRQRLDAGERLPLLGVPVAIKDDNDVAGELTACGSSAVSTPAAHDAEVVARLRAAGAVILGKTAVPELMIFPFTESLTFGATRNPWDTALTPGGSSGGSGAAVAAGLAPLALGSDGGGSIRIPSGWCGLFGIKPQRDRVPLAPHHDAWCGLSVNGPIARTVEDAALFLDVTTTTPAPDGGFVGAVGKNPGRLRIALSTKVPPPLIAKVGKEQRAAVDAAGALLRDLGHDVVVRDPDYPPAAVYGELPAALLPRYLQRCPRDAASRPARKAHPQHGPHRVADSRRADGQDPRRGSGAGRSGSSRSSTTSTSSSRPATPAARRGSGPTNGSAASRACWRSSQRVPFFEIWNLTGQPAAAVPWGLDAKGIPLSIQLVGRPNDEATLVSLGAQIEAARPWAQRRPPVS